MTFKKGLAFVFCLSFVFAFASSAYATIEVKGTQGTLIITDPNATDPDKLITMIDLSKQPIPPIPNGAILEIFDGEFTVTISGGDSVDITILDHELTLKGGTVTVRSGESEGLVSAISGDVTIVDPVGQEILLKEGDKYPIKLAELDEITATAAGDDMGLPGGDNAPPVDTRSMESSPAQ